MELLFSVIIPLYNKEKYIMDTINSVLSQTVDSLEVLIVDDGSTDHGPEIVRNIPDPRIKLIQQKNAGVSAARNCGIKASNGTFICFLDADDVWEKDFLQTVKDLFDRFPEAGMACPSYQVSYGERIVHPVWKSVDLKNDSYVDDFYEMATAPFWVCNSSCAAVRRKSLQKMKEWFPEGETVYEDFDFWMRLGATCKVAHSNKICATYRRETSSNARKTHTHKVVYSSHYMKTLDGLLQKEELSPRQKEWVKEIRDRRMVPYIFSLCLMGDRGRAAKELHGWKPCATYHKYKIGLIICSKMPCALLEKVQKIRMRIF